MTCANLYHSSVIIQPRNWSRAGMPEREKSQSAMAEDGTTAVSLPSSPYRKSASPFSSSFRFLGFADPTDSSPSSGNHYELDEGDVVWSPEIYSDLTSGLIESPTSIISCSPNSESSPISPSDCRRRPFLTEKLGLAVALTEDRRQPMNHRRSAANLPIRKPVPAGFGEGFRQSAPVNVPAWPRGRRMQSGALMVVDDGGEDEETEQEMLPPHVIVARSHVTTFSVFEGVGRTLKGRDLCRVRNAVLQKTGFID